MNLRGLGSNRTLVLLDGRRAQPADASLEIDLNTLPVAALDSVEVVTGGAASTYGADAMAGVINFKLKHRFEGVVIDAQYGQSFHNDDKNVQGSVLLGANVADNHGNVMFGATLLDRTPVYVQDRKWANAANTDPNSPGGAFPGFPGFNLIPYVPGSFTPASGFGFNIPSQAAVNSVFSGYPAGTVPNTTARISTPRPQPPVRRYSTSAPEPEGKRRRDTPARRTRSTSICRTVRSPPTIIPAARSRAGLKQYSFFGSGNYEINEYVNAQAQGYFTRTTTDTAFGTAVPAVNQWGVHPRQSVLR